MFVCLLILFLQQRETFYGYYDRGLDKLEAKQYHAAIADLERAVGLRKNSSPNAKTYGVQMRSYLPYHHLALAYFFTADYPNAEANLNLAYQQDEDEDGGDAVAAKMQMIRDILSGSRQRGSDNTTAKAKPDMLPVTDMLLRDELDDALDYIDLQLRSFASDTTLLSWRGSVAGRIRTRDALAKEKATFQTRLEELLAGAREQESSERLEAALKGYASVVRFDAGNSEAQAALVRVRSSLTERGESQAIIQEIERSKTDKNELEQKLEDQMAETQRLRKENTKQEARFNKRLRDMASAKANKVEVSWGFAPVSSEKLLGNMRPSISTSIAMTEVTLFVNGEIATVWPVEEKVKFVSPGLFNYSFPKNKNDLMLHIKDIRGTTSQQQYSYIFPRTPKKQSYSRSFKTAIGLILCSGFALIFFFNQQRLRRAFRDRFNPYVAGAPILSEKMFYGRSPILKQILNALHNNSLMIFGERRIGKTSFLHRLDKLLPEMEDPAYEFIPVFIDLQGVQEDDFFTTLDHEINQVLDTRGIALAEPEERLNARRFTSRLRKSIGELKKQCRKKPKLVLLLDEVDVMNSFSEQTNQQLRSVFMKGFAEHIAAIMAGIHINTRWKSEGSPWYNFFEQIELKPFPKDQAELLISRPVAGIYSYTNEAIARIMEITDGKPYLIQKMCLNLISYILLNNKRKITASDVNLVFKNIEKEFYGA